MSPEHFRALAHALKLVTPLRPNFACENDFVGARRQWIEAVKLTSDVCAAYGFTRTAFLDACGF